MFEVWNKIDLLSPATRAALRVQDDRTPGIHALSAVTGEGIDGLLAAVSEALDEARTDEVLHLPFAKGKLRAWLHEEGVVTAEAQDDTGYKIDVRWTARQKARFKAV
jgi:GTP-binding protein HflX